MDIKTVSATPIQAKFIKAVLELAESDKEMMSLFVNRASGLTHALKLIDGIAESQYKGNRNKLK